MNGWLKIGPKPWWAVPTLLGISLLAGCGHAPKAGGKDAAAVKQLPWQGVKLRLLVVEDAGLAETIGRLRGEWRATTGADLDVIESPEADLLAGKLSDADADAIVYPAYDLGLLVEGGLLRPLPDKELSNSEVAWEEIFEADKTHEASWAATTYGFPFGSPALVCFYRKDLLARLDRPPPRTWADYEELASLLADREKRSDAAPASGASFSGTMEPLASGWAGLMLLARAAPYAKHRNHYSTLFDMQSMDPLIAGPPFVRALQELTAAKAHMPAEAMDASPERVHEAFLQGTCGMAVTWTSAAFGQNRAGGTPTLQETAGGTPAPQDGRAATGEAGKLEIGFVELPGSPQAFNPKSGQWESRRDEEASRVALVGLSGRLGSVTKHSSQPEPAFQLLGWLSGQQWSGRVSTASGETTLFRRSHLKASRQWSDPRIVALAALGYAESVERTLGSADFFGAPRIAGRARYLAALDEAVRAAVAGDQTSEDALEVAAGRWRQITTELGLEQQRAAYRRSLGLR